VSVDVCLNSCKSVDVSGVVPVSFDVPVVPGANEVVVTASSKGFSQKSVLTLLRMDVPSVLIKDVSAPDVVKFGDSFVVSFVLYRDSFSLPQNVNVVLTGSPVVELGELFAEQEVSVRVDSSSLSSSNDFVIDVSYQDEFGKSYSAQSSFVVRVSGVPWYKRLFGWFSSLF
jgi:hypothetical protein